MRHRALSVLLVLAGALGPAGPAAAQEGELRQRFGLPRPRARSAGTLRLASYNVLNLFDHDDDPALAPPFDDIELAISPERAEALAGAIRAVDADVLALQEVESKQALTWFRDTYLEGLGYLHVASLEAGNVRGIECSILSRLPIVSEEAWAGLSLEDVARAGPGWAPSPEGERLVFRRSPLRVDLRAPSGYELTVFAVHHKSGRDFDHQREAEALKIVDLIRDAVARDADRNVVVMGDFNAAPWDKSLRVYLEAGFVDVMAHRSVRGAEGDLYKTHQSDRVLDYILLNPAAYGELVVGSAHVYGTPTLHPRAFARAPYPAGYAADHFPVVVDLVPRDR